MHRLPWIFHNNKWISSSFITADFNGVKEIKGVKFVSKKERKRILDMGKKEKEYDYDIVIEPKNLDIKSSESVNSASIIEYIKGIFFLFLIIVALYYLIFS